MPANKKYLTKSPLQKFAKITAAFIGGYILTEAFFMVLIAWTAPASMIFTLRYAGFVLWAVLMIIAFIAKNGWSIWGIYLLATLSLSLIAYCGNTIIP
ncbi:hypothetical protein [Galbibacter pacificus]|uniref:Uncharacterized protein n=1 Tax=Galbibacter pacificus TaxID=2996052 RepID=A0ABT6FN57_9FLAO|nr:hypothetical protein [Galbibacter pacificus]MDG3581224.1 hypothetical protein [Galbibacter pacificus]MDG3584702.1 hypothetical protein [Galbibacter pacificus]